MAKNALALKTRGGRPGSIATGGEVRIDLCGLPQASFRLIPIKFVGGLLAIGSGLALGREGPSVQTGASIGDRLGQAHHRRIQVGGIRGFRNPVIETGGHIF
jgi:hypothetical protein